MRLRLVPVGEIFRRMPFVVRDLARETGTQGAARAARAGHRDRQVPDRADDGSGPAPGAQRRQPRLRAAGRAASRPGKPEEGTLTLAAASVGEAVVLEIADDGRGIDAAAVAARARALGLPAARRPARRGDAARRAVRARLLDARRDRSRQRPRRRHGRREDDRRGAERDDDAADRARRGHALRHRAAADAVDHRRPDRARRRPRVRGAAGRRPRGDRDRAVGACARSRSTRSRRSAAARCRSCASAACSASPERPRRALHVFVVGAGVGRGRHRGRSHRRPAGDRRARHGRRADQGGRASPARPISATAASC